MLKNLMLKMKESFFSVVPITLVIFALLIILVPVPFASYVKLFISAILLIVGICLFSLGADNSMVELGQGVGSTISRFKKIGITALVSFVIGFMITFAEPDLMVLANQVAGVSSLTNIWIFIATVSLGVGIFMILAVLKIFFRLKLSIILAVCYTLILILAFFVPSNFMPICFDSGSVTTGPISVPFLLSFGVGLCASRSGKNEDDSFGLIALSSAGPILAVMLMSLFLTGGQAPVPTETVEMGIAEEFASSILTYLKDVALVILPLILLFAIFQIFSFKFKKQKVLQILIGFVITYIGIVLFLTGVSCGYSQLGKTIGEYIGTLDYRWIAIPIGFVLGAFAIIAEPALQVLKKQVETITGGVLKQSVIVVVISVGVALSVVFAVIQNMFDFSLLYIIVPVYFICILLTFFNTKLFTSVAFDSGGVATGAMAVSFTLPFVMGISSGDASGFGTIALIAAFPILTMQLMGFVYKIVLIKNKKHVAPVKKQKIEIIDFEDFDYVELTKPKTIKKTSKPKTKTGVKKWVKK